jgi:perosamine synthetase
MVPQFEPLVRREYAEAVATQVASGWLGSGKATAEFESHLCRLMSRRYCISTTSGTTALLMALHALKLGHGAKVLFPAYTFLAGANAARFLNLTVRLVDIRRETMCMDPALIEGHTDAAAAIFVNHNGYVGPDVARARKACDRLGIPMIEDSAQCLGIEGAGLHGAMNILSFSVPKLVTTGQGGAILTDFPDLFEHLRRLRDHGEDWRAKRTHEYLGVNFKFNDVLASLGNVQLRAIDDLRLLRRRLLMRYRRYIKLADFGQEDAWMAVYNSPRPDRDIAALAEAGYQAVRYYCPLNHNPPYADGIRYPEAEHIYATHIYLPSSLGLTDEQVNEICGVLLRA